MLVSCAMLGILLAPMAGAAYEPTTTMSTAAAFKALDDISLVPMAGAAYEPTITMSTMAAFDALNGMFSDHLPHEHGWPGADASGDGRPQGPGLEALRASPIFGGAVPSAAPLLMPGGALRLM
jgi:hypothetical protein